MKEIKKILILRTEHIGDFIISLYSIGALKKRFPKSKIDVVIGPWNKKIAESTKLFNKIILFKNPLIKRNLNKFGIIFKIIKNNKKISSFKKWLKKQDYDLTIIFSNRKFYKLFLPSIKSKKIIYGKNFNFGNIKEKEKCLKILMNLRIKKNDEIKYYFPKEDQKAINKILKSFKSKKKIIIHPITPIKEKNWPIDKWTKLINFLIKKDNKKIFFLIGTFEDSKGIQKIIKKTNKEKVFNLAGKLDLIQTTFLIKKSNLFVGNDSGPMHLAESVKTPVIALFGSEKFSPHKMWGPFRKNNKIIKRKCIKEITVNEVLKEIK
jgi:heptosyltransferase III